MRFTITGVAGADERFDPDAFIGQQGKQIRLIDEHGGSRPATIIDVIVAGDGRSYDLTLEAHDPLPARRFGSTFPRP